MKNLVLFLVMSQFFFLPLQSQTLKESFETDDVNINIMEEASRELIYLFEDYNDGIIFYRNQRTVHAKLNYSLLQDIFIVKNPDESLHMLKTNIPFDSIKVNKENKVFIYRQNQGYYELIEGSTNYYVKHQTDLAVDEVKRGPFGTTPSSAKIGSIKPVLVSDFDMGAYSNRGIYMENPVAGIVKINLKYQPVLTTLVDGQPISVTSRRELNRLYPEHRSEIRNFIRSEKTQLDNMNDQIKLAKFLETL